MSGVVQNRPVHVVVAGDYPRSPSQIGGGVEAHVLYLTQALQQYPDLHLDVVTLDKWQTGQGSVKHGNVTVHYLPSVRLPSRLSEWGNVRQLKAKIVVLNPDLIHAQVAGGYAKAAAASGFPWMLTLHGIRFLEANLKTGLANRYRGWFIKRDEISSVKRAKHIISINPFIQQTFDGKIQGKVYDIENAVLEDFFYVPEKTIPGRLLFAGRLVPRKGVHVLLQAFARLHQRMPEATLHLAGGGLSENGSAGYPQQLLEFVAEKGLTDAVTFLGEVDQSTLIKEYAECSALVLSSVLETAPMVITQAMAAGKAVVSTDAGGARYMVRHGQTGYIVRLNDDEALADALYQALSNEQELQMMGHRAKEIAKQCSHPTVVAAQTRAVYYDILGRTPPS